MLSAVSHLWPLPLLSAPLLLPLL
jgi:hypothetical protein